MSLETSAVLLTVLKLWALSPDYDDSNRQLALALRENTIALHYQYLLGTEKDAKMIDGYKTELRKSVEHSTEYLVKYLGERVPGCFFPEATIPGYGTLNNFQMTVRAQGPAGKLIDLEILENGVSDLSGKPCAPISNKEGFWNALKTLSTRSHTVEITIAVLGCLILLMSAFETYLEEKYPTLRRDNRYNRKPGWV